MIVEYFLHCSVKQSYYMQHWAGQRTGEAWLSTCCRSADFVCIRCCTVSFLFIVVQLINRKIIFHTRPRTDANITFIVWHTTGAGCVSMSTRGAGSLVLHPSGSFLTALCESVNAAASHRMNRAICSEHHLLCTLEFTGISSARETNALMYKNTFIWNNFKMTVSLP